MENKAVMYCYKQVLPYCQNILAKYDKDLEKTLREYEHDIDSMVKVVYDDQFLEKANYFFSDESIKDRIFLVPKQSITYKMILLSLIDYLKKNHRETIAYKLSIGDHLDAQYLFKIVTSLAKKLEEAEIQQGLEHVQAVYGLLGFALD